jgi:hypothetical protein
MRGIGSVFETKIASRWWARNFELDQSNLRFRNVIKCRKRFFTGGGRFVPVTNSKGRRSSGLIFFTEGSAPQRDHWASVGAVPRPLWGDVPEDHNPISISKCRADFLLSFQRSGRQPETPWLWCSTGLHSQSRKCRVIVAPWLLSASNQCRLGKERLHRNRLPRQD